ncbi:MAG: non-heme iron oxygenase ferredoxin subunit [Gemmatimonadota bacterium]|nr:non-heme iron oxygenase ferredoxin subunit [Gemmatimonadota bacterium]
MAEFTKVGTTDEIPDGEMKGYEVNGVRVGVANLDGEFRAFHDCCTHQQYTLSDSMLIGDRVTCDWHGAAFDLKTGEVKALPATKPLPIFEVDVRGDEIWVAVPPAEEIEMPPE